MIRISDKDRPRCNDYICAYSCIQEFGNAIESSEIRQFVMKYDYEMYMTVDAILDDALHKVESRFLSVTSSHMGLDNCDPIVRRSQFQFGNNYTWIHDDITIGPDQAAVASLGSAPLDKIDEAKVGCLKADNIPQGSTCIPIQGALTVGYYGDESMEDQISKSIRNLIERGSNDGWFITSDEITKIVYCGEEEQDTAQSVTNGFTTDVLGGRNGGENFKLSNGAISMIIAAAAAMIIGVAFLAKRTRRKRNEHIFVRTPSPKAGKKSGLRAHDSECIRTELNDRCVEIRGGFDPFETESQKDETPPVLSENNHNVHKNPTSLLSVLSQLSTITEGSKETSSHGNRLAVMTSPMVQMNENFNMILSESTYSDGVHSLGRSVDGYDVEPKVLYEEEYLETPSPTRCEF